MPRVGKLLLFLLMGFSLVHSAHGTNNGQILVEKYTSGWMNVWNILMLLLRLVKRFGINKQFIQVILKLYRFPITDDSFKRKNVNYRKDVEQRCILCAPTSR